MRWATPRPPPHTSCCSISRYHFTVKNYGRKTLDEPADVFGSWQISVSPNVGEKLVGEFGGSYFGRTQPYESHGIEVTPEESLSVRLFGCSGRSSRFQTPRSKTSVHISVSFLSRAIVKLSNDNELRTLEAIY